MIVETANGRYQIDGDDAFPIAGDPVAEVTAAVEAHVRQFGTAPDAVTWDDAVLEFRPTNLRLSLVRVFVPPRDTLIAARLDSSARAAVHQDHAAAHGGVNAALVALAAREEAEFTHAAGLLRFVGWPEAVPLLPGARPVPGRGANSIAIVINYRDKSATTINCLKHLSRQAFKAARVEIVLVNNRSQALHRDAVAQAAAELFGGDPRFAILHIDYGEAFNHSEQCNRGVAQSQGEALVMMSNDCLLLDPDVVETIAAWSLMPGVGTAGPRIVGYAGSISSAGVTIAPASAEGATYWRIQDSEVEYLSQLTRHSCGNTFGCAAVARRVWIHMGGLDGAKFPTDYNDADFALRLLRAGYHHLFVGELAAFHQAGTGEERTRSAAMGLHDELRSRYPLDSYKGISPYMSILKRPPDFHRDAANHITDLSRLYRMAINARAENKAGVPLIHAAEALLAELMQWNQDPAGMSPAWRKTLTRHIREICAAYIQTAPKADIPVRYVKSFALSETAFEDARTKAGSGVAPVKPAAPAPPRAPVRIRWADPVGASTVHRLLVFADRFGPIQQIAFLEGLKRARARGEVAVHLVTEDDLTGPDAPDLGRHMQAFRPTACIFSQFGLERSYAAIATLLQGAAFRDTTRVFHAGEDVFGYSVLAGASPWQRARHPRRIHTLHAAARSADVILAATPALAESLAARFGPSRILCPEIPVGGEPCAPALRDGPLVIGHLGTLSAEAAAAMRDFLRDYPDIALQQVSEPAVLNDYGALCGALRQAHWDIGLLPWAQLGVAGPAMWAAFTQAGTAMLAQPLPDLEDLARRGLVLAAPVAQWGAVLQGLLEVPRRRQEMVRNANRALAARYSWDAVELDMLSLLSRACRRWPAVG